MVSIPLIPTKKAIGERWLGKALNSERGDADVLGFVLGNDGWEFVPCDIESDGEEQWFVPIDGSKRYPADGVSPEPTRLYGCPVAVGYKDFGAVSETTNSEIARDIYLNANPGALSDVERANAAELVTDRINEMLIDDTDLVDESEIDVEVMSDWVRVSQPLSLTADETIDIEETIADEFDLHWVDVVVQKHGDEERSPSIRSRLSNWWGDVQWSMGWSWTQGGADTLVLEQDGDSAIVLERANYHAGKDEPEWYIADKSGYRYDARGIGAEPSEAGTANLAVAFAPVPKLLAPSICRVARNMHEGKICEQKLQYGGHVYDSSGNELVSDGGTIDGMDMTAKATVTDELDLEVEERAFVSPEDIKLLGGAQETQDKIETLLKQTEAKENTPGGTLASNIVDFGKIVIAFILGAVLAGGGGDGGGASGVVPLMLDMRVIDLVIQAGVI